MTKYFCLDLVLVFLFFYSFQGGKPFSSNCVFFLFDDVRKAYETAAQCLTNLKHDNKEETSELGKQSEHRLENIKKSKQSKKKKKRYTSVATLDLVFV